MKKWALPRGPLRQGEHYAGISRLGHPPLVSKWLLFGNHYQAESNRDANIRLRKTRHLEIKNGAPKRPYAQLMRNRAARDAYTSISNIRRFACGQASSAHLQRCRVYKR